MQESSAWNMTVSRGTDRDTGGYFLAHDLRLALV